MEDDGVAFKLETPVWIDENGNQCVRQKVSNCKVTHGLTCPEMCFVVDEVGGSASQKGDRHIGGM